jgi:Enoyl-CoA hydratase/isomerase
MIDYEVIDGIAYIRLNRPEKLNAFTNSGLVEYVAALDRLDRDDDAQIGIVSGAGRAFSSGSDINQRLLAIADDGVDSRSLPSETQAVLRCENYKPLVAAVHGYAIGHALGTALLCELVVAAEDTRFQVTETSYGVPTASFWAHIACATGASFANDVVLTGRFFTAEEAFRAGPDHQGRGQRPPSRGGHDAGPAGDDAPAGGVAGNGQVPAERAGRAAAKCRYRGGELQMEHDRRVQGRHPGQGEQVAAGSTGRRRC